ncbi:hypothetical protein ACS0TY_010230 [Phlomoides rotata]
MEGGGGRERKSGPLVLNWDKLLTDDPPQEVIIEEAAAAKSKSPVGVMAENSEEVSQAEQCYREISEKDLAEKINRAHGMFKMKLPDGGEKLRANLKKLQAEQERRMRMKDANKDKTVIPLDDESTDNGATDALSARRAPPSAPASEFALRFCSNLNDEKATKCFGEELSTLNCSGGHNNMRERVPFSAQRRDISSRQTSFKSPRHLSVDIDNVPQSDEQQCGSHSSNMCADQSDKNVPSCSIKKKKESAARGESPLTSRRSNVRRRCRSPLSTIRNKRRTFVLVDEEEPEIEVVNTEDEVLRSCKGTRVYYPSRDDPEAIEISYSDMECLAPESYVSSPIMNFYIRYLQKITSARARRESDYHFFNTFFYEKLKQDVLAEVDRETSYLKFRRWWKGVNIFEKAFIFLPVHENLHWSLVIICIPNKEEKSGPIILHLDSLGMHSSKSVFSNTKRFLIEEWKFLREDKLLPAPPITENIWENLSRRIVEKVLEVPQQRNDYDCGLFVLYFMQRFLEEVPERLRKSHLEMFGRKWFKPEEASGLRRTIRELLIQEFTKANEASRLEDLSK